MILRENDMLQYRLDGKWHDLRPIRTERDALDSWVTVKCFPEQYKFVARASVRKRILLVTNEEGPINVVVVKHSASDFPTDEIAGCD